MISFKGYEHTKCSFEYQLNAYQSKQTKSREVRGLFVQIAHQWGNFKEVYWSRETDPHGETMGLKWKMGWSQIRMWVPLMKYDSLKLHINNWGKGAQQCLMLYAHSILKKKEWGRERGL